MARPMRKVVKRMSRQVGSLLMLAIAVASSSECLTTAQNTPVEHACCVGMKGTCDMAIGASCCPNEKTETLGVIATKPQFKLIPGPPLVAILSTSPPAKYRQSSNSLTPKLSSSGPPGVPTYLFVSSFRI